MPFKACTCGDIWESRNDFLSDPLTDLVGYQVNFRDLEAGFFLFNHLRPTCETTMTVPAGEFTDLHKGPIFRDRLTGMDECRGYCLKPQSLDPCPAKCECAYVRDVLTHVKRWRKLPSARAASCNEG